MTLNGAIMQLVEMRENSLMPAFFKPYFDKVIETVSECEEPSAQIDPDTDLEILSSGVWDAKELPTTQPDKIEVHLQEPYALMIKEVIVKETTYRMATKQETVGELTRCKDCKHYKTHISCIGDEYSGCDYWINDGNESPCEPTDFCSYAERREVTT